jgi:hypothetical protein
MTTPHGPLKRFPQNPSEENLRKRAKRLAREQSLQLADAQYRLAAEYGYKTWAELMRAVASRFVPLLPLRELVAFPHQTYPIFIGRPRTLKAVEAAEGPCTPHAFVSKKAPILMVAQRDSKVAMPSPSDMHAVGTLGVIVARQLLPDGTLKVLVEGIGRARVVALRSEPRVLQGRGRGNRGTCRAFSIGRLAGSDCDRDVGQIRRWQSSHLT